MKFDREVVPFFFGFLFIFFIITKYIVNTDHALIYSLLLAIICSFFFRDPGHYTLIGTKIADNFNDAYTVRALDEVIELINETYEENYNRLKFIDKDSRFLSLFDVHVQYSPVAGVVIGQKRYPGTFLMAFNSKLSTQNERVITLIKEFNSNRLYAIVRIAGNFARRIRTDVEPGTYVNPQSKIGLIRFGSRVDTYVFELS